MPVQTHAMAFGLFASLVAPFGGFFASGFKRAFNIKVLFLQPFLNVNKTSEMVSVLHYLMVFFLAQCSVL